MEHMKIVIKVVGWRNSIICFANIDGILRWRYKKVHNKITQELLIFQIQCEVTIAEESKFAMEKKSKCDTKQDVSLEEKETAY